MAHEHEQFSGRDLVNQFKFIPEYKDYIGSEHLETKRNLHSVAAPIIRLSMW